MHSPVLRSWKHNPMLDVRHFDRCEHRRKYQTISSESDDDSLTGSGLLCTDSSSYDAPYMSSSSKYSRSDADDVLSSGSDKVACEWCGNGAMASSI